MRNFDEHNITEAVLERVRQAPTPRAREVSEAMVRHLHDFVREVEPTFEEWLAAIDFLTEVGKNSTKENHEFILLSDTLGVSMLVDAINHRLPKEATQTTVMGPFYVDDAPVHPLGADISADLNGVPLLVTGTVSMLNGAGKGDPLVGATVDTWQSDGDGYYDVQHPEELGGYALRGRFHTDDQGRFWFWSVVPTAYSIPAEGPVGRMLEAQGRHPFRPAHVHFMIGAPGYTTLITHVFVEGDKYLDSDVVFGVKTSLIEKLEHHGPGTAPDGTAMDKDYAVLDYDFVLAPVS
jgi:hydroxyquinol 1,2-dioxygenase